VWPRHDEKEDWGESQHSTFVLPSIIKALLSFSGALVYLNGKENSLSSIRFVRKFWKPCVSRWRKAGRPSPAPLEL
jgi:hypothetical protein